MLGILILSIVALCIYNFIWKRKDYPPGPTPWPLFGNILSMASEKPQYEIVTNWAKEFGGIYTMWLGEIPVVCVCDFKLMHDAFVKNNALALSGKYTFKHVAEDIRKGPHGIIDANGDKWMDQRRFALQVLKDFGFGKNLMEEKVLDEVAFMLKNVEKEAKSGEACNVMDTIDLCIGSVINNLLFGYRFEGERLQEFLTLKHMITRMFVHINRFPNFMIGNFPWLRHVPYFADFHETSMEMNDQVFGFIQTQMDEHEKQVDVHAGGASSDFCEAYFKEMHRQHSTDSPKKEYYCNDQLKNVCYDLWLAGLETTTTTLHFAVIYLLNHPDVLKKAQEELDRLVPGDRLVTMKDRAHLPYTQAVLSEVQRVTNLLVLNLFHQALEDVSIGGHLIKKDTIILPQISCVLYDENVFPEPLSFKPERFLAEDGSYRQMDEFVPFSVGKRSCLGESLAKMELFLVLSNLIKHFDLLPEKSGEPPSMEKRWGFTVQPHPFKVRVTKRST